MPNLGRGAAVGIGAESTWGTAVARTVWFPLVSVNAGRTITKVARPVLHTGGRNIEGHYVSADDAGGSFVVLMGYEGLGLLLQHALWGTPSTQADTPSSGLHTHTYLLASSPPTGLTIEVVRGTGTAEVFEGCRITRLVASIQAGGLLQVTVDFVAETSARAAAGTPTFTANMLDLIHHQAGSLSFNSNSYTLKSWELTIDNKLARRQLLGSSFSKDHLPSDFLDVGWKMALEWNNDQWNSADIADTQSDAVLVFTGLGSRTAGFTLHNAFIRTSPTDPISQVGVIEQQVSLRGQRDSSDEGLEIEIVNTQATALAA